MASAVRVTSSLMCPSRFALDPIMHILELWHRGRRRTADRRDTGGGRRDCCGGLPCSSMYADLFWCPKNGAVFYSAVLPARPGDGDLQPVGQLSPVTCADGSLDGAVRGDGQRDGHIGVRGRRDHRLRLGRCTVSAEVTARRAARIRHRNQSPSRRRRRRPLSHRCGTLRR